MTLRFANRRAHARATDKAAAAVAVGAMAAAAGRSTAAIMVVVVHGERRSTLGRASSGRWRVVRRLAREDGGKNLLGVLLRAFASGARGGTGRHGDMAQLDGKALVSAEMALKVEMVVISAEVRASRGEDGGDLGGDGG